MAIKSGMENVATAWAYTIAEIFIGGAEPDADQHYLENQLFHFSNF